MATSSKTPQADALKKPFPPEAEKQLKKGGGSFTYIPIADVIGRLNDVLGEGGWTTVDSDAWRDAGNTNWVVAKVTLEATIDGATSRRIGWGGQAIKQMKSGDPVDLGDEFKGATSDALKKAASQFGVALYLSRDESIIALEEEAKLDAVDPIAKAETMSRLLAWAKGLPEVEQDGFKAWWKDELHAPSFTSGKVRESHVAAVVEKYDVDLSGARPVPSAPAQEEKAEETPADVTTDDEAPS